MRPTLFAEGNRRTVSKLEALRQEAHADKAPRVALRIQGVMLSLEKHRISEIAQLLHVNRASANSWIQLWNAHREEGLMEGQRSGRPPKLTEAQKERLYDIVESGPVAYGLHTGVWTSPILCGIIEEEFGIFYHPGHVRKLLKDLGFSRRRPTTKLVEADPKLQNKWVRYTYPNLKKKPTRRRR